MKYTKRIIDNHNLLLARYKTLIEQAYNFRQTDSALSDISEYKAIKLLHKINKLKYLNRDLMLAQQN
ncbi:Lacal_2735 family protein [Psychroserpens luteolus]|uniref:Lacal_2735 family protein n=1 Tax=Psychroserpens luteolus TaxID=2855840 RepID=UPI001E513734|nr:Lacal_2735 family protein [Psychroserpens luteolus]MCD2260409.1 Lacal_2735 family protein [Psychroserpens luteolus]